MWQSLVMNPHPNFSLIKMRCEINLLNWKFNRRRQFFNCLPKFSCKREAMKKIDDYTFLIALIVENIYNFLRDVSSSKNEERNSSSNANSHPRLFFLAMCSVWCLQKKIKWTFAGGEVDLGIRCLLFFRLLAFDICFSHVNILHVERKFSEVKIVMKRKLKYYSPYTMF
jgi:hypothetical protein